MHQYRHNQDDYKMINWNIEATEMVNCNCNFGCPCQFSVLPTDGLCEAAVVYDIHKGHYGDVILDGIKTAAVYQWPGPIHEGNGQMQLVIEDSTNDDQRAAIQAIMMGEDTDEMATMWYIYSLMAPNKLDTLYKPISCDINSLDRIGTARVLDVFDVNIKPIPHIVSGAPHRVLFHLPNGFEFTKAEVACGTTTTSGEISLQRNNNTHAHFAALHLTGSGVVRQTA